MADLPLSVVISTAKGDLEVAKDPYDLDAESLGDISQTWRRRQVDNPWVEGSFLVAAHREMQTVPLNIIVEGATSVELNSRISPIVNALTQLRYTITVDLDGVRQRWSCEAADFTVDRQHIFRHARMAIVKAQVPRHPRVVAL